MSGLRLLWDVWRAEGPAAFRDRALDRRAARRRRAVFTDLGALAAGGNRDPRLFEVAVLVVLPTPPRPDFGGVQQQLLRRLGAGGGSALLYPDGGGYRLEVATAERRLALRVEEPGPPPTLALADDGFERAVERAASAVGARAVHVEGVAELPPSSLRRLAERRALILSLHDFGLFCPRPHLVELPRLAFCDFCRDDGRCRRCLASDRAEGVGEGYASERRRLAGDALAAAAAAIFPSATLLAHHEALFPASLPAMRVVVPPAATERPARVLPRRRGSIRRLGVVGSVVPHKGSALLEALVEHPRVDGLDWTILGGGDREALLRLRRHPRVRVRGYYRTGALPGLLDRERIDLALLLSIWPETYALTFDECVIAGVPVVAFDHGAIAERARRWGGAVLVPPSSGVEGVAAAVAEIAAGKLTVPEVGREVAVPDATSAAEGTREVYRRLGLEP